MKNEKRNYILVGTFVIAMVVALIVWVMALAGRTGPTDPYFVVYENVTGLEPGAQIKFEGFPVGAIDKIEPADRDGRRVFRVGLAIKRGWPVDSDSEATIAAGLFSATVIDIAAGNSGQLLEPGAEIRAREAADLFAVAGEAADTVTGILDDLGERAPKMMENVEVVTDDLRTAMEQINSLLDGENVGRVDRILANVEGATQDLNELLGEVRLAGGNLNALMESLDNLLDEEDGDVSETLDDLRHTTAALASHIDAITSDLEDAIRNANEFSKQIREDPSVLLRGREVPR